MHLIVVLPWHQVVMQYCYLGIEFKYPLDTLTMLKVKQTCFI